MSVAQAAQTQAVAVAEEITKLRALAVMAVQVLLFCVTQQQREQSPLVQV
jgi:hypothetical protein